MTNDKIKLKVDTDFLKIELHSSDPQKVIKDLNSLVSNVKSLLVSTEEIEEEILEIPDREKMIEMSLRHVITPDLKSKREYNDMLNKLLMRSEGWRHRKQRIVAKQKIDLDKDSMEVIFSRQEVGHAIEKIFYNIPKSKVETALLHIIGPSLDKQQMEMISDSLKKNLGLTETMITTTEKNLGSSILLEAVFFGNFPSEQSEDIF